MRTADRKRAVPPPPPRDATESLQRVTVAIERIAVAAESIAATLRLARQPIDVGSLVDGLGGLGDLLRGNRRGG